MGDRIRQKWVSIALISLMVPMSLLATFRFTGVLHEPLTPEMIAVDAIYWNMSRPTYSVNIVERVDSSYTDSVASVGLGVNINAYARNLGYYGYNDLLWLRAIVTANVTKGFISLVVIRFSRTDAQALLDIDDDPDSQELSNLELVNIKDPGTDTHEAYIEARSLNNPTHCYLKMGVRWFFLDQNDRRSHELSIALEFTYFNGTAYRKVVMPVILGMVVS